VLLFTYVVIAVGIGERFCVFHLELFNRTMVFIQFYWTRWLIWSQVTAMNVLWIWLCLFVAIVAGLHKQLCLSFH